jgi:hypothetical protein
MYPHLLIHEGFMYLLASNQVKDLALNYMEAG